MDFLFPKTLHIFDLSIIRWLGMHAKICPFNNHMLKSHTLVLKISLITQQFSQEREAHSHTLIIGPNFGVLWASHGSNPKFDPPVTTVSI